RRAVMTILKRDAEFDKRFRAISCKGDGEIEDPLTVGSEVQGQPIFLGSQDNAYRTRALRDDYNTALCDADALPIDESDVDGDNLFNWHATQLVKDLTYCKGLGELIDHDDLMCTFFSCNLVRERISYFFSYVVLQIARYLAKATESWERLEPTSRIM